MRVTDRMSSNNLLLNLNRVNSRLNKYQSQLYTGQKIQYASEDPIIAALALKFRTNVNETVQYKKNVEQAISWIEVSEGATDNAEDILKTLYEQCVQGASEEYNFDDRQNIVSAINQLSKQLITEANVTYAGRYVFGGYKTDQEVIFSKANEDAYNITEQIEGSAIVPTTVLSQARQTDGEVRDVRETNDINRFLLSYTDVENLTIKAGDMTYNLLEVTYTEDAAVTPSKEDEIVCYKAADGKVTVKFSDNIKNNFTGIDSVEIPEENIRKSTDYGAFDVKDGEFVYLEDTGELLVGDNAINGPIVTVGNTAPNPNQIVYDPTANTFIAGSNFTIDNSEVTVKQMTQQEFNDNYNGVLPNNEVIYLTDTKELLGFDDVKADVVEYTNKESYIMPASSTNEFAYSVGDYELKYIKDTGEILVGSSIADSLKICKNIDINYDKVGFEEGDLNPQQYFECKKYNQLIGGVEIKNDKIKLSKDIDAVTELPSLNIKYTDTDGNINTISGNNVIVKKSTDEYVPNKGETVYLEDTGEVVFAEDIQAKVKQPSDMEVSFKLENGETYSNTSVPSSTLEGDFEKSDEKIEYEFGVNSKMQINTQGNEIFKRELIQDLRDIVNSINSVKLRTADEIKEDVKSKYGELSEEELDEKVSEIQTEELQTYRKFFSAKLDKAIGKINDYQNSVSTKQSEMGVRINRLELIQSRLDDDKINYTDLMTSNESTDYEETFIEYMNQQTSYNAALQVGANIMQKSLIDYI